MLKVKLSQIKEIVETDEFKAKTIKAAKVVITGVALNVAVHQLSNLANDYIDGIREAQNETVES